MRVLFFVLLLVALFGAKLNAETILLDEANDTNGITVDASMSGTAADPKILRARDVHKFRVSNPNGHAVVVKADHVVLEGWHITSAGDDGIKVYGKNVTILNCRIEQTNDQGIACHRGTNLTVENCEFVDCGNTTKDHGLYCSGVGHTIVRNDFSGCHGYGIHVYQEPTSNNTSGGREFLVEDNTIHDGKSGRGILWLSQGDGGNIIRGNVVEDSTPQFNAYRVTTTDLIELNSWQGPVPAPDPIPEPEPELEPAPAPVLLPTYRASYHGRSVAILATDLGEARQIAEGHFNPNTSSAVEVVALFYDYDAEKLIELP